MDWSANGGGSGHRLRRTPDAHRPVARVCASSGAGRLSAHDFEDAIAACNLLPGPASTQLAIFSAWRVAGPAGAVVGGVAFIVPGLVLILALAALFLGGAPPTWVLGAGAGAGAAVAAVAVRAGTGPRPTEPAGRQPAWRWALYAVLGAPPRRPLVRGSCSSSRLRLIEIATHFLAARRSSLRTSGPRSPAPPPPPRAAGSPWCGWRSKSAPSPTAAGS